MGETCDSAKKTRGEREAMRAASLIVLDAGNSSGEEGAVWPSAVTHIRKWKE